MSHRPPDLTKVICTWLRSVVGVVCVELAILWVRKTRATARDVPDETSPADTTLASAVALYWVRVDFKASLDSVKLRRNEGVESATTVAKPRSRVAVVVARQLDGVGPGRDESACA